LSESLRPAPGSRAHAPGKGRRDPKPGAWALEPGARPFAHPVEAEFARLLDFYRVRWEYEPRTFPLEWDEEGRIKLCFTPDFYLPDQDLYVELTTMSPRLVRRKNRKLRRLQERYPDVRVKLFYQRDVRALLLKYGLTPSEDEA
jgi:hypothetical protein